MKLNNRVIGIALIAAFAFLYVRVSFIDLNSIGQLIILISGLYLATKK